MLKKIGISLLIIYSITIASLEYLYGQTYVRSYLTDIQGDATFYGVNTTLATILLVLIAYNFMLCILNQTKEKSNRKSSLLFQLFQILLFLFLAMDERFMIHEKLGYILGFEDAFLLLSIGFLELAVLYFNKELLWTKTVKSYSLYLGGMFFGIMILIDAFGPDTGMMRLSLEDLSKLWGIFFLFIYSFEYYKIQHRQNEPTLPIK